MTRIFKCIIALSAFLATVSVSAQECDHLSDAKERFDAMRMTPPSKVSYYDGFKMEFVYSDKQGVYLFNWDVPTKDTVISADFKKNWKTGLWFIIYCVKDNHIYAIARVDPKQLKYGKTVRKKQV